MVRHSSPCEATCLPFAKRHAKPLRRTTAGVGPEGTDLQTPNFPVGRGLYGPTFILSRSDMPNPCEETCLPFARRQAKPLRRTTAGVGPEGADLQIPNFPVGRGLYGPTSILSRSDMPNPCEETCLPFARRQAKPLRRTTAGVGPEGADLQIPNFPVGRGLYGPTSIPLRRDMHPLREATGQTLAPHHRRRRT